MAKNSKQTSSAVASKASKILKDGRYGKTAKSVAGSALSQTKPGRKEFYQMIGRKNPNNLSAYLPFVREHKN